MKISKILFLAAVVFIAVAVFSCGDDDSDSGLGVPGVASVKSLQPLLGATPAAKSNANGDNEIEDLLDKTLNSSYFRGMLSNAYNTALSAQLTAAGIKYPTYGDTSYSYNVKINDTTALKTEAGVAAASITGNASTKITANRPEVLLDYFDYYYLPYSPKDGDKLSYSQSEKITYNISTGYYKIPYSYGSKDYYISGIITVESKGSANQTLKNAIKNDYEQSFSSTDKVSVTVAIYSELITDTSKKVGAKFTFSGAEQYSGKARTASESTQSVCSDIIVYRDDGVEYDRIRGDEASYYLRSF